jgi:hypothetical protein
MIVPSIARSNQSKTEGLSSVSPTHIIMCVSGPLEKDRQYSKSGRKAHNLVIAAIYGGYYVETCFYQEISDKKFSKMENISNNKQGFLLTPHEISRYKQNIGIAGEYSVETL